MVYYPRQIITDLLLLMRNAGFLFIAVACCAKLSGCDKKSVSEPKQPSTNSSLTAESTPQTLAITDFSELPAGISSLSPELPNESIDTVNSSNLSSAVAQGVDAKHIKLHDATEIEAIKPLEGSPQ
jgi:hypothetical protein